MLQVGAWPSRIVRDAAAIRRPVGTFGSAQLSRLMAGTIIGLLALFLAAEVIVATHPGGMLSGPPGFDYRMYMSATQRLLAGGGFYAPNQLAGPYAVTDGNILYPPTALALFVPFTILPAALWWAIPLGILGWVIAAYRPSPWTWVAIVALVALPFPFDWHFSHALVLLVTGNPAMWIAAAVAAGTRWGWPAALVLVKPSLAPLALIGIHDRRWWVAIGGIAIASLVLLPLWTEYVTVLANARGPRASLLYSITDLPLMLIPIVAWLGRAR